MSSNKKARQQLEKRYGAECFIEKLHLRKDTTPRKYKGKAQMKRMKQLTYHHLQMKKDGGKATIENGAILSNENHIWLHKQPEVVQSYLNAIFKEYKKQVDECAVKFVDYIDTPYEIKVSDFVIEEKDKEKYNRAKKKQEDKELIKEWEEER